MCAPLIDRSSFMTSSLLAKRTVLCGLLLRIAPYTWVRIAFIDQLR